VTCQLFTGGTDSRRGCSRRAWEIKKLEQQKDDWRNQIALDVKTALLNLQSARNEVQVANLGGAAFERKKWTRRETRFKAGVANNIEVIQAQDSLGARQTTTRLRRLLPV